MKRSFLLVCVLLSLSSCATLFSGKSQSINLMPSDSHEESEVEISNGKIVQSVKIPTMVIVPRSNNNLVIKVKENTCYKSSQTIHESRINLFTLLNVFGSWFSTSSTSTDSVSGALWAYDNSIMVNTQKKPDCKK